MLGGGARESSFSDDVLDCDIVSSSSMVKFDGEPVDDSVEMEILSLKCGMFSGGVYRLGVCSGSEWETANSGGIVSCGLTS